MQLLPFSRPAGDTHFDLLALPPSNMERSTRQSANPVNWDIQTLSDWCDDTGQITLQHGALGSESAEALIRRPHLLSLALIDVDLSDEHANGLLSQSKTIGDIYVFASGGSIPSTALAALDARCERLHMRVDKVDSTTLSELHKLSHLVALHTWTDLSQSDFDALTLIRGLKSLTCRASFDDTPGLSLSNLKVTTLVLHGGAIDERIAGYLQLNASITSLTLCDVALRPDFISTLVEMRALQTLSIVRPRRPNYFSPTTIEPQLFNLDATFIRHLRIYAMQEKDVALIVYPDTGVGVSPWLV